MPIRSYGSPGYNYNNTRSTGYGSGNYNGGMHGSGTYNSPYGMYSSPYGPGNYNGGMHGSGIYNSPYGVGMHGMGMGMGPMAGPGSILNALSDPNNPFEGNNQGLSFWQSMLQKLHWMMIVSGNIVSLITENTQTVHVIASALYAFLDRSGMLAGFVLKLLRMSSKPKLQANTPTQPKPVRNLSIEGPQGAQSSWDKV
ncbi:hypothetical protein KP509_05G035300 [Ceratopteris richardii]|nr:hypothetical protein KP509_05G035300 [Ceratopteris richardii]